MPFTAGADLGGVRADLGAIPFGGVDAAGVAWALQTLEGWDSAEVRSEYTARESGHGSWASPVYLGSRPITLTGTVTASDRASLENALERLRTAVTLEDTTLVVYEMAGPKQSVVRRSGKPLLAYVTDRIATYSVLVTAADPRRYGSSLNTVSTGLPTVTGGLTLPATMPWTMSATSSAGQIDAFNAGSFETKPLLAISGPVLSPRIQCQMPDGTVRALSYSQDLLAGDSLVIDTDAHTVVLNGNVSRRRFLTLPSGWPTIPPVSQVSFFYQAGGYNSTTLLTASWRSAWM